MELRTLRIKNFRGLTNIETEFSSGVSVIVGPNAIGKTSILEAIRLAKALLAPRIPNESLQTLVSLGAAVPHLPQQLIADGLVQDTSQKLEICCQYHLSEDEVNTLENNKRAIAVNLILNRNNITNPANSTSFLSSPFGQNLLENTQKELEFGLKSLIENGRFCNLDLTIEFQIGKIHTPHPIDAALFAFLDQSLPPDKTKFSYFPADRALPRGETPVQLGAQDASQQLEAHVSQPHLKYQRLKNTIFGTIISSEDGRKILQDEFEKIFSGILRGKELIGVSVSDRGLLSIKIKEKETNHIFDIDGLSSGEKGLALTFLLISRTISKEGIVLLDEPELHLNPAVCKNILHFLIDKYVNENRFQIIMCSHSPEIVASAFELDNCNLYHLVSTDKIVRISRPDREEVAEALSILGTSESDGLLYKGTIFVEGEEDLQILEAGFPDLLRQYKIKSLGGRGEVEKQIVSLQNAEKSESKLPIMYFIFDNDGKKTDIKSTNHVKILQWNKRCLENYLIDIDNLTEFLKNDSICANAPRNSNELRILLRNFSKQHLKENITRDLYERNGFDHIDFNPKEISNKDFNEAGRILFSKIEKLKNQISSLSSEDWIRNFVNECRKEFDDRERNWNWEDFCDGKRLLSELHRDAKVKVSLLIFKKRIIQKANSLSRGRGSGCYPQRRPVG